MYMYTEYSSTLLFMKTSKKNHSRGRQAVHVSIYQECRANMSGGIARARLTEERKAWRRDHPVVSGRARERAGLGGGERRGLGECDGRLPMARFCVTPFLSTGHACQADAYGGWLN